MFNKRRLAKFVPALALIALAVPSSAFGQASRTWVSGVGDDVNPCSRTAPCKTFAGAISKTAAGGEINVLDPGGFGGVTITKSLTIKAEGITAGVVVSGTNAIVINAGVNDKVTLKGLDIIGLGTGLVGVKIFQARTVHLVNDEIYRFQVGFSSQSTAPTTNVAIINSHIHDNGIGVFVGPGSLASTTSTVTLRDDLVTDNTCNIAASSFGANGATPAAATNCGSNTAASGLNQRAIINAFHSGLNDATNASVFARGSQAIVRIGDNDITQNSIDLLTLEGGAIRSFGDNYVAGNATTNAPTSVITRTKVRAKRSR
jgi:hypothetical protein